MLLTLSIINLERFKTRCKLFILLFLFKATETFATMLGFVGASLLLITFRMLCYILWSSCIQLLCWRLTLSLHIIFCVFTIWYLNFTSQNFIKLGSEPDIKYTWVALCDFSTNYISIVTLYTWGWEPLKSDLSLILSISLCLHISNAKIISPQLVWLVNDEIFIKKRCNENNNIISKVL